MKGLPQAVVLFSAVLLLGADNSENSPPNPDNENGVRPADVPSPRSAGSDRKGVADHKNEKTPDVSQESIDRWIRQLRHDVFGVRQNATRRLIGADPPAVAAVMEASGSKDPEVRRRAVRILREIERRAAEELEKHGARVQWTDKGWVRVVSFRHHRDTGAVKDPGAEHLAALPHLEILELCFTQAKDKHLVHLRGMSSLAFLRLDHTLVTDNGLVHLKGLNNLNTVNVGESEVTGAGLTHLSGLPELEHLSLSGPQVMDASVLGIRKLMHLRSVALGGKNITGAAVIHLCELPELERLRIDHASITDRGLRHVRALHNLTHLLVDSEGVTDAAIDHLTHLKELRSLALLNTRVTARGVQRLKHLRKLRIVRVYHTPCHPEELRALRKALVGINVRWDSNEEPTRSTRKSEPQARKE